MEANGTQSRRLEYIGLRLGMFDEGVNLHQDFR